MMNLMILLIVALATSGSRCSVPRTAIDHLRSLCVGGEGGVEAAI